MRLRNLVQDDDAVSPVIGVILMVAITVILAAVIASFVLGLGNQAGGVAPNANFEFNYNSNAGSNGFVNITHVSGDSIRLDTLFIRGENFNTGTNGVGSNNEWDGQARGTTEGVSAVQSGDMARVQLSSPGDEYVIRLIWEDPDGDTTSQLAEDRGPNAT